MDLSDFYRDGRFGLSFELFPPKTTEGERVLFQHLEQLLPFDPSFITCTYGAGGSTRDKTLEIVDRVKRTYGRLVASHLTCVGATVAQLEDFLGEAERRGVDAIVALRGDPPAGSDAFQAVDGGLRHASELVALIRRVFPSFGIAVGGYPETHREAASPEADLEQLKRKVDTGADIVVTQLFYDNADFFRFRDRCAAAGIAVPIVPGILPVTVFSQIQRITTLCGARLPQPFSAALEREASPAGQFRVGVAFAIAQLESLRRGGVPGVHFYVLNKSQATCSVLQALGWRERKEPS